MQWVLRTVSLGVKRPGRETEYSPLSIVEVKNGGAVPPLPNTDFSSDKHQNNWDLKLFNWIRKICGVLY
jgi:hypothetical protein